MIAGFIFRSQTDTVGRPRNGAGVKKTGRDKDDVSETTRKAELRPTLPWLFWGHRMKNKRGFYHVVRTLSTGVRAYTISRTRDGTERPNKQTTTTSILQKQIERES